MNFSAWIFFSLISPFIWGLANLIDRALIDRLVKNEYALTFAWSLLRLPAFLILFIFIGFALPPSLSLFLMAVIAGIFNVFPVVFYLKAMREKDTSGIILLHYICNTFFVLILGFVFLSERFTLFDTFGFLSLLLASVFSIMKFDGNPRFGRQAYWTILAAFLWAISDVLFKVLISNWNAPSHVIAWIFLGGFLGGFFMLLSPEFRKNSSPSHLKFSRNAWILVLISILLSFIGYYTFLRAVYLDLVSLTVVIVSIQPLFVFLLQWFARKISKNIEPVDMSFSSLAPKVLSLLLLFAGIWFLNR